MITKAYRPENWRSTLTRAFRSRSFLWKFAITLLLIGTVTGYVGSKIHPSGPDKLGERILALAGASIDKHDDETENKSPPPDLDISSAFAEEIARPGTKFSDILWALPLVAPYANTAARDSMREALQKRLDHEQADLAFDYLCACDLSDRAAFERLKTTANRTDAPRFANFVAGQIELKNKNYQPAYERFHQEGQRPEAGESRSMAIHALVDGKIFSTLTTLSKDPQYARYITPFVRLEVAIDRQDWRGILRESPLCQIASYRTDSLILTFVAGLAWAFFLGHMGEIPGIISKTAGLCLLAFGAGVISTVPTLYLVVLEEDIFHFTAGSEVPQLLAYYVGGVAVREELCKLLLFMPLLPFLIRRNDELEALVVASFVGLGFAIEENTDYFMASESMSATGRFLTANFLHVSLAGVTGLALFRACKGRAGGINEFLFIFPLSILVHGLYDALPDFPNSDITGYAAMVVYVIFATYYFNRIHPLRTNLRTVLGLTGAFVISISVLAAAAIAFAMINLGPAAGLTAIVPEFTGSIILLFMFFREFNEPLSP